MELINSPLFNILFIAIGALIGSIKANFRTNTDKSMCEVFIDVSIGLFCGLAVGFHYAVNLNIWYSGMIALIGSSIGVNILDLIKELSPNIAKRFIDKWLKNKNIH